MEETLVNDIITMPSYEEFLESAQTNFQSKSRNELINLLKKNISDYEQKYDMKSNDFASRFEKCEFENNDKFHDHDLFRWWSDYKSYLKLIKKRES